MAYPLTVPTVYAATDPIKSVDLNSLLQGGVGKKHGLITRTILPQLASPGPFVYVALQSYVRIPATTGTCLINIPTEVGDQIMGCRIRAFGDGAQDITYTLKLLNSSMAGIASPYTAADSNRVAAWGTVTLTGTTHLMAAGESLRLEVFAITTGTSDVGEIELDLYRP